MSRIRCSAVSRDWPPMAPCAVGALCQAVVELEQRNRRLPAESHMVPWSERSVRARIVPGQQSARCASAGCSLGGWREGPRCQRSPCPPGTGAVPSAFVLRLAGDASVPDTSTDRPDAGEDGPGISAFARWPDGLTRQTCELVRADVADIPFEEMVALREWPAAAYRRPWLFECHGSTPRERCRAHDHGRDASRRSGFAARSGAAEAAETRRIWPATADSEGRTIANCLRIALRPLGIVGCDRARRGMGKPGRGAPACLRSNYSETQSAGRGAHLKPTRTAIPQRLRIQLGIPIEIIQPAVVQIVRREQAAVTVQLVHGRRERRVAAETSAPAAASDCPCADCRASTPRPRSPRWSGRPCCAG